jgi:uncharacterized protein (TIGR02001 family)
MMQALNTIEAALQMKRGSVRAGTLVGVAAIAGMLGAPIAIGGEKGRDAAANGDTPQFSTNAAFATDYRFRGFTQTREKSALQGGVDVTWRQFYVGAWATNVDFGRVADALGRWHDTADYEVDVYAGVKHKIHGFETDVGFIYYAFPGAYGVPQNLDYVEVKAGVSREIYPSVTSDVQVYYSPDYQGETGPNWVLEGGLTRKLGTHGSLTPSVSTRLGYSAGDEAKGGLDYWYWNAGLSVVFAQYFEFDLRYFDTFDVPTAIAGSCRERCDGRVVARITFEN